MIAGDKSAFYRCGFAGYQDTLWDDQGRHYFDHCSIQGAVDFIFGMGQSIYEVYADIQFAWKMHNQYGFYYISLSSS